MADPEKGTRAFVVDSYGKTTKVVDLIDRQVGTTADPKNLTVSGKVLVPDGSSYIYTGPGVTATTQSNGQVYVSSTLVADPSSMPGLQLWCEASLQNVVFDTGSFSPPRIRQWTDLSQKGNHLFQTVLSAMPRWNSANPSFVDLSGNSLPTVEFQSGQVLISGPTVTLSSFTLFLVTQVKAGGATLLYEHSLNTGPVPDGSYLYTSNNASGSPAMFVKRNGFVSSKDLPAGATWASSNATPVIITQTFNGQHAMNRLSLNNWDVQQMIDVNVTNVTPTAATTNFCLGARGSGVALPCSASFAAIAVYSPALSSGQAARVARYFGDKFGVVAM